MVRDHALCFDEQWKFSMKFLISHDNGVWGHDIVVSELRVAALGMDGLENGQEYPLIPICSTLHCGIKVAGCNIRPGWAENQFTKLLVTTLGLDRPGDSKKNGFDFELLCI